MASVTPPCIYKSVPLAAGEQFTLPPGAEIVSASAGLDSIKSTCALPDTLEEPICYKFRFSGSEPNDGLSARNWELADNFYVRGIVVNGITYDFANDIQLSESGPSSLIGTWSAALNGIPQFNGLFTFLNGNPVFGDEAPGGNSNGFTIQLAFSVIPSIGDNLQMKSFTSANFQYPLNGTTFVYTNGDRC
jgi:hypothetical protein